MRGGVLSVWMFGCVSVDVRLCDCVGVWVIGRFGKQGKNGGRGAGNLFTGQTRKIIQLVFSRIRNDTG
jgi:hypothetical protein